MLDGVPEAELRSAVEFLRKIDQRLLALQEQELYPFHNLAQVQALVGLDSRQSAGKRRRPAVAS